MTLYQPGQDKPAGSGRKRGTPNKRTAEINDELCRVAVENVQYLSYLLKNIDSPERRTAAILKLLALTLPRGGVVTDTTDDDDDLAPEIPPQNHLTN